MRCLTRTQNPNNIAKGKKKCSSIFKANELYSIIRLYRDIEKKNISANQDEAKKNNCHKQLGVATLKHRKQVLTNLFYESKKKDCYFFNANPDNLMRLFWNFS